MMHRALVLLLVLSGTAAAQSAPSADVWRGFDDYVAGARKDWRVPGLAIAVVDHDSVVFAKGYGVRRLGGGDTVGVHTLFANASTTKAFTALVVAMMVDAGKVRWDDPVVDYLPAFQLRDPYATRALTVRQLLTHRAGFGDPSYLWAGGNLGYDEMLRRLRYVEGGAAWQPRFLYNNVTYAAAGEIAARATGLSWDELIRRRILIPLGMRDTYTDQTIAARQRDIASPHFIIDDTVRVIERSPGVDNIRPAGAMYSTVMDMTRWMRFLLDSARMNGARLVSDSSFTELFTPQTLVGRDEFYPTAELTRPRFTAYGLGWFMEDYRGETVAFHTGSIDGTVAIVGLLPERRVGVVVFANLDHAEVRHALMYRLFDIYVGEPHRDWSTDIRTLYDARRHKGEAAEAHADSARILGTRPSLPLEGYAGTYVDSLFGEMTVRLEGGALVLEQPGTSLIAHLEPWNYDTFQAVWHRRQDGKQLVTFRMGTNGRIAGLDLGGGLVLAKK
jgi:CubicO group peptidase (beta-lactamase class C family)